ncbi:hypothetical protein J2X56_001172 [Herbaspirillum sp. 1173]|uniref:DUF4868 domain-containing protein n=1 Tax=Herbaspirillum sp. 1173 TaxID=2817734 RepID=UPI002860A3A0|nr:DUF4868 domain-containing protein [Herbaspirillum sp. 1173]MDR6739186.1 hypothetical protein [Herbaspirillum sp. 1173]
MRPAEGKARLAAWQSLDLDAWSTSFWLVRRKLVNKTARYEVIRVDADTRLQARLKGYVRAQVQRDAADQARAFHVAPYDFNTADGDDVMLTLPAGETDFAQVAAAIQDGFSQPHVQRYEELLGAWAYVPVFEQGVQRLHAWRKIGGDMQPKRVRSRSTLFFRNHRLVDVEDEEVFLIDPGFDFFAFDGTLFIANKRQFEIAMNFREGMKTDGAEVLADIEALKLFTDVGLIRQFVGNNLHHLRKLAAIRAAGYYRQPDYIRKLKAVSQQEGWNVQVEQDRIVVDPDNIELLLKLLNNDRLRSPINDEMFDSAAKSRVD